MRFAYDVTFWHLRRRTPSFFRLTQIRKNSENRPYGGHGKNRLGRFRLLACLSEGIRNLFAGRSYCR